MDMKLSKLLCRCLNNCYIIYEGRKEGILYSKIDIPQYLYKKQVEDWWIGLNNGRIYLKIRLKED